jgi:hypothetical protein
VVCSFHRETLKSDAAPELILKQKNTIKIENKSSTFKKVS